MSYKYNQLVLPYALWSGSEPTHNITCVLFLGNSKIATGSETGMICLWKIQENKNVLAPEFLLTGHQAPITSLVRDTYSQNECLVSISQDGTLCLWDTTDGLCLKSHDNLLTSFAPTSMTSIGDNRHVVISGHSHQAAIIDVPRMIIELQTANHDDWVTGVFPCNMQISNNEHVFLSLCKGILRFWTLTEEKSLDAIQTIVLDMQGLRTVSVCPNNITFLAVSSEFWALFSASNSHCIEQIRCPYSSGWDSGIFIDSYHVIIWTCDGNACLYRIPDISKHHPMDFGHGSDSVPISPSPNLSTCVLLYKFSIDGDTEAETRTRLLGSQIVCCCSADSSLLCFADERGCLSLFEVPLHRLSEEIEGRDLNSTEETTKQLDEATIDRIHATSRPIIEHIVQTLPPIIFGSISDTWEDLPVDLPQNSEKQSNQHVTISRVLSDSFSLLYGYNNGDISLQKLPYDESPRIFRSCHQGKVTALMQAHVAKDNSKILLTGGEDCLIHAWDQSTGDWLRTWPQHCGKILQLLPVPPQAEILGSKGCFLSVASDFSIGLFSYDPPRPKALNMFTGHNAPIVSVQLRLDQDYLFVTCEDETVTIWELSTGEYEGCHSADSLKEITNMAMTQLSLHDPPVDLQTEIQSSITLFSSDATPPRPCADILLLNIRQIIEETHRRAQFNIDSEFQQILLYYCFLIPWGLSEELDLLAGSLGIRRPNNFSALSPGLYGDKGKMTLFIPQESPHVRFSSSNRTTAVFLLSALAFTNTLLQTATQPKTKTICSQLLSQFGALIYERVQGFKPPCLGFLTNFWRDKTDDICQSARSLFFSTLDGQTKPQSENFMNRWISRMESSDRHNLKNKAIPGLLLAISVADRPRLLEFVTSEDVSLKIANSLVRLILGHPEISYQLLAADILARGYSIWGEYIGSSVKIFQHLLKVTTPAAPGKLSPTEKAILGLATKMPSVFITTVSESSRSRNFSVAEFVSALRVTNKLIKKVPFSFLDDFVLVVEYVIRSISPKLPTRTQCLKLSNTILMLMVSTYPMASYDVDTQRFAIGTKQKTIVLYDLKSCKRGHILTGHNASVDAVSFSSDGKTISSFSSGESLVCFWSCGSSGLWFNSPPRCLKGLVVTETVNCELPKPEMLQGISLEWSSATTVKLVLQEIVVSLSLN